MTRVKRATLAGGLLLAILVSGCRSPTNGAPTATPTQREVVYAAIGASETYGIGATDRYR